MNAPVDSFAVRDCLDQIQSIRDQITTASIAVETLGTQLQEDSPPAGAGVVVHTIGNHLLRLNDDLEAHLDWLSMKALQPQLAPAKEA